MNTIGYLVDASRSPSPEEDAAWEWLAGRREWAAEKVVLQELRNSISHFGALWLHDDSSLGAPPILSDENTRSLLHDYVAGGGALMLSLLGAQAAVGLGWESNRPNVIRKGIWDERCWAEAYPDIRGFASYLGHPIFDRLRGAVYTWNPTPETEFAGAFYEAPHGPLEGRVVAVERQYIKVNDERRLIWEYTIGKGRALAIGTFLFFADPKDRFRAHRDVLAADCLQYLLENPQARTTHWEFAERTVREVRLSSGTVSATAGPLPTGDSGLALIREAGQVRDHVFDLGGRRILVMGREQSGIQEIWCHPVRVLKTLRIGIRAGDDGLTWLAQHAPNVTVKPESVTRVYETGEVHIEETTVASQSEGAVVVHLAMNATHPFELIVSCSVDLRLMWPYPDHATGSLLWAWDEGLRAFVVRNAAERLSSIVGSSRAPEEVLAGRFSSVTFSGSSLSGTPSELVEVGLGMRYACRGKAEEITLVVAGSGHGVSEALTAYRHAMKHPGSLLLHQVEHYRRLFTSSTVLRSPDDHFNDGYRWALAALDRFLVETPSLGTSLMAGFGTTDRGWDGDQTVSGRPGYAWYFGRDAVWSALALLEAGQTESVREVLSFLGHHQDVTGKVAHELTTSGHAHYDAADSTPLYCILMGRYVRSTGDVAFARAEFTRLSRALEFCFSTDTDRDGLIENTNVGHGWIEGGKLFGAHTELYLASCWAEALEQAATVAGVVGKADLARAWKERAGQVRSAVSRDFWHERTGFYSYGKMADGSYRSERTVLPAVAAYFRCVDPVHMSESMRAYASSEFSADWGVRIIGRSDPLFSPMGYHEGSVWPLFTGWVSLAEFALGSPLQGFEHLMSNLNLYESFAAGYAEEVLHGERFEPAGVCSHQAWSEGMVLQPALEGLAGIMTDGRRMKLTLRPFLPASWNSLTIERLRVGQERLDVHLERRRGKMSFAFRPQGKSPIAVTLQMLLPLGSVLRSRTLGDKTATLSGMVRSYADCPVLSFTLIGAQKGSLHYADGVGLEPLNVRAKAGALSTGVRCVQERMENQRYELLLEGPDGQESAVTLRDPAKRIITIRGAARWVRSGERVHVTLDPQAQLLATGYRRSLISVELTHPD